MNNIDYFEVKRLLKIYKSNFCASFTTTQSDLVDEYINKIDDLDEINKEIVDLVNNLTKDLSLDEDEIATLGPFKIKLQRADPNIPIGLDNATRAYPRGNNPNLFSTQEIRNMERKLERLAAEFYKVAFRLIYIARKLPSMESFKCKSITIIRNQLIEHPEGKDSGVTYDSFSYSKNEGPYIKGLRKGSQLQHMDKGFSNNVEEFIFNLNKVLREALN